MIIIIINIGLFKQNDLLHVLQRALSILYVGTNNFSCVCII